MIEVVKEPSGPIIRIYLTHFFDLFQQPRWILIMFVTFVALYIAYHKAAKKFPIMFSSKTKNQMSLSTKDS